MRFQIVLPKNFTFVKERKKWTVVHYVHHPGYGDNLNVHPQRKR